MSWKEHLGFGPGNERLRLHESYLLLHQADTGLHLGEDLRERAELVDLAEQLLKFSFHRQSFHFDTEDRHRTGVFHTLRPNVFMPLRCSLFRDSAAGTGSKPTLVIYLIPDRTAAERDRL